MYGRIARISTFQIKLNIDRSINIYDTIVESYTGWNNLAETNGIDLQFHIEDPQKLCNHLENIGYKRDIDIQLEKNSRHVMVNKFNWEKQENVSKKSMTKLDEWCLAHDYIPVTNRIPK